MKVKLDYWKHRMYFNTLEQTLAVKIEVSQKETPVNIDDESS